MPDPPLEYILEHWLTTAETARITGLQPITVREYCLGGKFHARKIANKWFVDPASARSFQKTKSGRKRKDQPE